MDVEQQYENLMSALADSCLEMTDEEIRDDITENGDTAEETRQILLNAIALANEQKGGRNETNETILD